MIKNKNKILMGAFVVLVLATMGIYFALNRVVEKVNTPVVAISGIPTSGKYCFARTQKATTSAPYSVEEHVVLNFSGVIVAGTKRGSQAGPDMQNGYEGTLAGATIVDNNEVELTYSYTVEGAKNKELEVYAITDKNLVKKRWALTEAKINGSGILVPDYKGDPTLITYTPEPCLD